MNNFINESIFFGVVISLASYELGVFLRKKTGFAIFNPLLISIAIIIAILAIGDIKYEVYYSGAQYISYLLTPATVCLAVPLYRQFEILKKNALAVMCGIFSGVISSVCCILAMSVILRFSHKEYVTFLPKSITTAIGMDISKELDGYVAISVAVIVITGVIGNVIADFIFKVFRINDPIARGVALGSSSHAVGTAKAMELGQIEGAISGLSIAVSGILTVLIAPLAANLL